MIKSFLRGFFASFLLLSMTASASAQTKTWRHSLYQGIGLSNKLNDEDKQTVALRIGYAVSYTIAPRWAVTQGVALRLKGFGKDSYFAGNCSSTYIDLPLLLQSFQQRMEKRHRRRMWPGRLLSSQRRKVWWENRRQRGQWRERIQKL